MIVSTVLEKVDKNRIPKHIAIIMDGNRRWAKENRLPQAEGHKRGVDTLRRIVKISGDIGLKYLTVYGFSTENWGRSSKEVQYLLKLIMDSLIKEIADLNRNNVLIRFLGSQEKLDKWYNQKVLETCQQSWDNTGLQLNIAMNYGGKKEILDAVNKIVQDMTNKVIPAGEITEELLESYLYTANIPHPDLIIRTSGEMRLSNFLVWQSAYSEFWFTETYWPEFSEAEFLHAVIDFQKRERRIGE
jgi:undecaprenyl diphosphate synthase